MADAWQDIVTSLYRHLQRHDAQRNVIRAIDSSILAGGDSALDIIIRALQATLSIADCRSLHLFLAGDDMLQHSRSFGSEPKQPGIVLPLAPEDLPFSRSLPRRDVPDTLVSFLSDDTNAIWIERLLLDGKAWGVCLLEADAPLISLSDGQFLRHIAEQLGVGLQERATRDSVSLYRSLHSRFFSSDLEEGEILDILGQTVLDSLGRSEAPLIQILFRQDAGLPENFQRSSAINLDHLFIRWSTKESEVGTIVPMDSVSGNLLQSNAPYVLVDPTKVKEYKSFAEFESRTEFAVPIKAPSGEMGVGVLNIEFSQPNALLATERRRIIRLIEMLSPLLAAVRRRNAMALTMRQASIYAVNGYLNRTTELYAHRFGSPLDALKFNIYQIRKTAGDSVDDEILTSIESGVTWLQDSLRSLWESMAYVAEVTSVNLFDLVSDIAREEKALAEDLLEWDASNLKSMPPVRGSRLLKEHIRNLIENAVDSIRAKQANQKIVGSIRIWAEAYSRGQSHIRGGIDPISEINHRVRFIIEDNGLGMDTALLERSFQPGFTTKDNGTGYGLPAAREYMKEVFGQLRVESREGEFCRIILDFSVSEGA